MEDAINFFNKASHQKSIAFVLSDFTDVEYENDLKVIGGQA